MAIAVPRHVLHVFSSFGVGGVPNLIVCIANAMQEKFRHTIFAINGDFGAAINLNKDIKAKFETLPWRKTGFVSLSNIRRARSMLRSLRPDILLTYNWGATEWALADRMPRLCPHIHFESGFGPDESPERQHWRRVVARPLLLSGCKKIVVPSTTLQDVAIRIWKLPSDRVLYVPNGVDCARFEAEPVVSDLAALNIVEDTPVVGTVAVLRREKNLPRLLRAFAALPEELGARLVIVGDGRERSALEAAAAQLGIADRVVFMGQLADPERILGRFDVFALSSDTEQMPISVLEAMAAGRPVAATDVGDVMRMLSPENKPFVVPMDDERALTAAMLRLLQDRALATRIGAANRNRARSEFSFETMLARYENLYAVAS